MTILLYFIILSFYYFILNFSNKSFKNLSNWVKDLESREALIS